MPLGAMFAFLAAIMAFVIAFHEYAQHYRDQRRAVFASLRMALVAFTFFCALAIAAGLVLDRLLGSR